MGEYFPYILTIILALFSSWLAIKLKFAKNEDEIKNSIKKLANKILLGLLIIWSLLNLFVHINGPDEITRHEVFQIIFHAAILLYILITTEIMRLSDILYKWSSTQGGISKKHLEITESIIKSQVSTANNTP